MPIDLDEVHQMLMENKFEEALEVLNNVPDVDDWRVKFYKIRSYNNIDDFSKERLEFAIDTFENLPVADFIPRIAILTEILTYHYRTATDFVGLEMAELGETLIEKIPDEQLETEQDRVYVADLLNNIAIIFTNTNQQERAIEIFQKRIKVLEGIDNPQYEALTHANLGYVYNSMGKLKNSLNEQLKALEIARTIGNKRTIAIYLSNIGSNYATLGDLELAEEALIESIGLSSEIKMDHLSCYTYTTLSSVYHKRGDYKTAISYLNQGNELQKQFSDSGLAMNITYKRAEIAMSVGNVETMKLCKEEIEQILPEVPKDSRLYEFPAILDALILKQSNLYKNKLKAENIFREFLKKEKPLNPRLQMSAFLHLSDLLLEQLQLQERQESDDFEDQEKEILQELQSILDHLNNRAILEESIDLQIQAQILIAYLKLANFKTEEAMDAFEKASFYSQISGIKAIVIDAPDFKEDSDEDQKVERNYNSFNPEVIRSLDNIIHSIPRLEIILLLTKNQRLTYSELKDLTGLTPGNLGRHCNKLVEAGYIFKDKEVVGDKFLTVYEMTPNGLNQFNRYSKVLSPYLQTP